MIYAYLPDDHVVFGAIREIMSRPTVAPFVCPKRPVCALIMRDNEPVAFGANFRGSPAAPNSCPRVRLGFDTGVGYHLCRTQCGIVGHAERVALAAAHSRDLTGCSLYLVGHYYLCDDCKAAVEAAGIETVYLPESTRLEGKQ